MSEPVLSTPVLHFSGNRVNSSLRRGGGKISIGTICQKNREQWMVPGLTPNSLGKKLWICSKDILFKPKTSDCFHTLLKKREFHDELLTMILWRNRMDKQLFTPWGKSDLLLPILTLCHSRYCYHYILSVKHQRDDEELLGSSQNPYTETPDCSSLCWCSQGSTPGQKLSIVFKKHLEANARQWWYGVTSVMW